MRFVVGPALGLLGLLVVLLDPSMALAGEEESKTFFAQGRQLRLEGHCDAAIPVFRKAYDTFREGLGALRNVAECEEQLSRYASARRSWWDLRVAALKSADPKYAGWDADAAAAFARLASKVPKLVVRLRPASPGARVTVNGRPIDASLLDTEIELDVGEVVVTLDDGGARPQSKKLQLEAGEIYEVVLEPATAGVADSGAAPGGPAPTTAAGPSPLIVAGGVSLGLAGLSLAGMFGAVGVRQGALGEVESSCPALTGCDASLRETVERGEDASVLVNVFAVGAGAAGALGVGLLTAGLVGGSSRDSNAATKALSVTPVVWREGAALAVGGSF